MTLLYVELIISVLWSTSPAETMADTLPCQVVERLLEINEEQVLGILLYNNRKDLNVGDRLGRRVLSLDMTVHSA